jgi:hypothetical protein
MIDQLFEFHVRHFGSPLRRPPVPQGILVGVMRENRLAIAITDSFGPTVRYSANFFLS